MGLIHFPTPVPFPGRSPKKYSGRRVSSIQRQSRMITQAELAEAKAQFERLDRAMEHFHDMILHLRRRLEAGASVEQGQYGFDGVIRTRSAS